MDAMIGRYRVRVEAQGVVLTHPAGICFDLSVEEALRLVEYLRSYRQTLLALQQQKMENHREDIIHQEQ